MTMRLISRPACAASLRQRCTSFSSSSSSGESFLSGWRSMPGTSPATSQFDWLISMTAISVLSWSKAVRDRLRSFDCGMGHSIGLLDSAEGDMPSPLAPYHLQDGNRIVLGHLALDEVREARDLACEQFDAQDTERGVEFGTHHVLAVFVDPCLRVDRALTIGRVAPVARTLVNHVIDS